MSKDVPRIQNTLGQALRLPTVAAAAVDHSCSLQRPSLSSLLRLSPFPFLAPLPFRLPSPGSPSPPNHLLPSCCSQPSYVPCCPKTRGLRDDPDADKTRDINQSGWSSGIESRAAAGWWPRRELITRDVISDQQGFRTVCFPPKNVSRVRIHVYS